MNKEDKNENGYSIKNKPKLRNCPFCGGEAYLKVFYVPFEENRLPLSANESSF